MRQSTLRSLFALSLAVLFTATAHAQLSPKYAKWDDGPEGFLLTKKEKKEWKKVSTDAQAEAFIELFWARRNPNRNTSFNPFRSNFEARVKYTDEEFAFKGRRGALSDRARVLILLGSPRYRQLHTAEQSVQTSGTASQATDQVTGNMERWVYDVQTLPEGFEVRSNELIFSFYEAQFDTNEYVLDRSNRLSTIAIKALAEAPDIYLLHPEMVEIPTPVSLAGARSATAEQLAWCDRAEAPLDDQIRIMSELGVKNDVSRPLWVHVELPKDTPGIDLLAGRVTAADGEVASNFAIDASPVEGQYGKAYHLAFPLEQGSYSVDIVGATAGALQFTERIDVEITDIPTQGTWMSPIWTGISATAEKEAPLGSAYTIGGWHFVPISGPDLNRDHEVTYFGFVVRPELDENDAVNLKVRIRLKKDGRPLGTAATMSLEPSHMFGDLYMYGNSVPLSGLPEPGSYSLEFKITEEGSDSDVEVKLPLEIYGANPFTYDEVKVRESDAGMIEVFGTVSNNTDESFDSTNFVMKLYDAAGAVITSKTFEVKDLAAGSTADFDVVFDHEMTEVRNFLIEHESEIE